ncbi:MAG: hypothetical protein AMJ42_00230 [Deltaproteobacteria bacterium DG_8]|nr:MAG: hypothetical protein AMJ42_00230 [Deltaproteobacteria bacterium DG_8]
MNHKSLKVKKVLIPMAGKGTRMMPLTTSIPKELLPIGYKPMFQYALEEAIDVGAQDICLIINEKKKSAIRDYLSGAVKEKQVKSRPVNRLEKAVLSCNLTFICQPEPRGLADAIYRCKDFVGNEPFIVALPDNVFFSSTPLLKQMLPVFNKYQKGLLGLIKVNAGEAKRFGNCGRVACKRKSGNVYQLHKLYNKKPGTFLVKEGKIAIRTFPRQIFLPDYFDYTERVKNRGKGEQDDVPVLQEMIRGKELLGCLLRGKGFDVGNWRGYFAANRFLMNSLIVD